MRGVSAVPQCACFCGFCYRHRSHQRLMSPALCPAGAELCTACCRRLDWGLKPSSCLVPRLVAPVLALPRYTQTASAPSRLLPPHRSWRHHFNGCCAAPPAADDGAVSAHRACQSQGGHGTCAEPAGCGWVAELRFVFLFLPYAAKDGLLRGCTSGCHRIECDTCNGHTEAMRRCTECECLSLACLLLQQLPSAAAELVCVQGRRC